MSGLGVLLRKEALEWIRTRRLLVSLVLFLLVGLGSPLAAKGIPAMLAYIPHDQMGGVELLLTREPGMRDAMAQYLKNFNMLPLLVVLSSMGTIAGERAREILPLVLSKPVSRRAYLLSKILAPVAVQAAGTLVAALGMAVYTTALFGEIWLPGYAALNGLLFLNLVLFATCTVAASACLKSTGGAAAVGLGAWFLSMVLGGLPSFARYTPAGLGVLAADLVVGRPLEHVGWCLASTVLLVVAVFAWADRVLRRQEI